MLTLILPQVPSSTPEMSAKQIRGYSLWALSLFFFQSFHILFTKVTLLHWWRWKPHMETTRHLDSFVQGHKGQDENSGRTDKDVVPLKDHA